MHELEEKNVGVRPVAGAAEAWVNGDDLPTCWIAGFFFFYIKRLLSCKSSRVYSVSVY